MRIARRRQSSARCWRWRTSARSASTPPSPRLSARRMKATYLMLTMRMSDQRIIDSTPYTFTGLAARPYDAVRREGHGREALAGRVGLRVVARWLDGLDTERRVRQVVLARRNRRLDGR